MSKYLTDKIFRSQMSKFDLEKKLEKFDLTDWIFTSFKCQKLKILFENLIFSQKIDIWQQLCQNI